MKVKVGDTVYSDQDQPVMVILTDKDKENIKNMLPHCTRYASTPTVSNSKEDTQTLLNWMDEI